MDTFTAIFERKKHNLCFLILEAVIMLPLLVRNFSWVNLGAYIVLGGWLYYTLMVKEVYRGNPGALVSFMIFLDLVLVCFMQVSGVWEHKEVLKEWLDSGLAKMVERFALFVVPAVIYWFLAKRIRQKTLLRWITMEVVVFFIVIVDFGSGIIKRMIISRTGLMILIFYTAVSVMWFAAADISRKCAGLTEIRTGWMSIALFVMFFGYLYTPPFIQYMMQLPERYRLFTETYMSWTWIVIMVTLSLAAGMILKPKDKQESGTSMLVLWGFAGFCLIMKLAQVWYFTYVWAVLLLYLLLLVVCFDIERKKDAAEDEFYGMSMLFLSAGFAFLIFAANRGFWALFLSAALIFLVGCIPSEKNSFKESLIFLLMMVFLALGFMFHLRGCKENYIAAAVITVFGIITCMLMTWEHPAGIMIVKMSRRVSLCALMALLLLIVCMRGGSKIKVGQKQGENTVAVSVEAKGKENEVAESYYYWTDAKGKKVSEDIQLRSSGQELEMQTECLTIVAVDKNGIKTTRKVWYPHGFWNMEDYRKK